MVVRSQLQNDVLVNSAMNIADYKITDGIEVWTETEFSERIRRAGGDTNK